MRSLEKDIVRKDIVRPDSIRVIIPGAQVSSANAWSGVGRWLKVVPAGYAMYVGRVGGLAVALGIGTAVATSTPGIAFADTARSDSSNSSVANSGSNSDARRHSTGHLSPVASNSGGPSEVSAPNSPGVRWHSVARDASTAGSGPGEGASSALLASAKRTAPMLTSVTPTSDLRASTVSAPSVPVAQPLSAMATSTTSSTDQSDRRPLPAGAVAAARTKRVARGKPAFTAVTTQTPPYFPTANWLWTPIPSKPLIATNSETWVSELSAPGTQHVADLFQYGVTLISESAVTAGTPRYQVKLTAPWGPNPFRSYTVPIPKGTRTPPGSDSPIAVLDPTTGEAFGLWQARYNSKTNTWSGTWGGMTPINGNGIDQTGSATGAGINRYAGVITAAEFSAAIAANTRLNHALVFSSDIAGPGFVGPATKSDGANIAGVADPIPEGYRIQLNPSIDVNAIPGITPAEKVIAKTLQTYGAYVIDNGHARSAFAFQMVPGATSTNPGAAWTSAGLSWDYYDMTKIPWSQLRVLAA